MFQAQMKWNFIAVIFSLLPAGTLAGEVGEESFQGASAPPVALIYKGEGSCEEGCSDAAAEVAIKAGFRPRFVGPMDLNHDSSASDEVALFQDAKVWIQPGGVAVTAFFAMSPALREAIRSFVAAGGGYVGFCAGAFMATRRIGSSRYAGLGILPGSTAPYFLKPLTPELGYSLPRVQWGGLARQVFFEGGPYFYGYGSEAETVASYASGYAAAIRAHFGRGRVFVSGPHPEAPLSWTEEDGVLDPDGVDQDLAIHMVEWASGASGSR
jgi:glutamine amidotransferase-like uncharacterized protein